MNADPARLEFAPPPTPGLVRALALAIGVHVLLLVVLALGLEWKRGATPVTVEAELWSALPSEAATAQPSEQASAQTESHSPPLTGESAAPTSVVLSGGIDGAPAKATPPKEKPPQIDQLEQEKRRREASPAPLPNDVEESPHMDTGETPASDPT